MGYFFLSYSRKDKESVEQLENRLKAAGYETWIDIEGIRGGDLWREAIVKAIDQADALLVLLSPNSAKSDNVCTELVLATENKTRIVPVDISTPPISMPSRMRYLLAGKQRVKFPTGFEKLLEALDSGSITVEAQQAFSARDERIPAVTASPDLPASAVVPVSKKGDLPWLRIGLAVFVLVCVVGVIAFLISASRSNSPMSEITVSPEVEMEAGAIQPVPDKAIIFHDDFSSNEKNWATGKRSDDISEQELQIADGRYRISFETKTEHSFAAGSYLPEVMVKDFSLTVKAAILDSSETTLVVLFFSIPSTSESSADYGYYLAFGDNGYYYLRQTQGQTHNTIRFEPRDAIHLTPGELNTFEVIAKDSSLTVYANGQYVDSYADALIAHPKWIWIGGTTPAGQTATIEFDEITITTVP
jgi:hypothetical protein